MNTAFQETLRQIEEADKAAYSDAVKLRNLMRAKGKRCNTHQADEFVRASETNLMARIDHARKLLAAMGGHEGPARCIIGTAQWIICAAETELERRAALAAAAE